VDEAGDPAVSTAGGRHALFEGEECLGSTRAARVVNAFNRSD
jgi:hypothetical protein